MKVNSINPYIHFNGNCKDAIALYERVLRVKAQVMLYGDGPAGPCPEGAQGLVMHAEFQFEGGKLMVSDAPPAYAGTVGTNVEVAFEAAEVEDMLAIFAGLSEGGAVVQPPVDGFWGAKFAMVVDPLGVHWILTAPLKKG